MVRKHLVLLGAPGVGKGTQAKELEKSTSWIHISTGDMLREAVRLKNNLGHRVSQYLEKGDLVPDEMILALVDTKLDESPEKEFILDGYPRTLSQAHDLDDLLEKRGIGLSDVINIEVPRERIIKRLSRRFTCDQCGKVVKSGADKSGENCPGCGGIFTRRPDDEPETIAHRLDVYEEMTRPLVGYYEKAGILHHIDGNGSIQEVQNRILIALALI